MGSSSQNYQILTVLDLNNIYVVAENFYLKIWSLHLLDSIFKYM